MKTLVKMVFGSHLYGTASDLSDTDYKGVYAPSLKDCLLNNVSKSTSTSTGGNGKNTATDVDEEMYSLQYFMHLAYKGEMIVLDMLHAPDEAIVESSPIWEKIRSNRSIFYSKNMKGYIGYIRKQTAKYSIKGERLASMTTVLNVLRSVDDPVSLKLTAIWDILPITEYSFYVDLPQEERWRMFEVCGKRINETASVQYALDIVQREYDRYGARAKQAELSDGVDWKAVSHAFRAAFQLKEMLETNDLKYPLKDALFIKDVKYGVYHYHNDKIGEKLDILLDEIECLVAESSWPDKLDVTKLNDIVIESYLNN